MANKEKIVILGGGVGAMTAAYQLTQFDDWQNRFDITIYQMGWRLGGKCASGRNAAVGQRIEEHGLHVWAGFYDNAIKLMKACYAEANAQGIDGLFPSYDDAFKPFNNVVLGEKVRGKWVPWHVQPPNNDAVAGEGGVFLSPWDYFRMALDMLKDLFEHNPLASGLLKDVTELDMPDWAESIFSALVPSATEVNTRLLQLHRLVHGVSFIPLRHEALHHRAILFLLDEFVEELHDAYKTNLVKDHDVRRLVHIADLALAALRGVIVDRVLYEGFDVIDNEEISAWLKKHGAHKKSLESACVRAIYDYAFGFSQGTTDYAHRAIAAGTSLKGMCRLAFTYKGSFFYEMQAGMGDTVFTPFYKLLKSQGVKFEFFHKLTAVEAGNEALKITRVKLQKQADLVVPEYDPLVRVHNLDCWPSQPDYAQLQQGPQLQAEHIDLESSWADWAGVGEVELELGVDFDKVILGVPIGGLAEIAQDLAQKDPRWDDMLREVKTTRTLAMQLWLKRTAAQLDWPFGETILTGYEDDFNTWADLSHLLVEEDWPTGSKPASVAYFCGPMDDDPNQPPYSDHGYPARERDKVEAQAKSWIEQHAAWMWPQIVDSNGDIDWDQLVSVNGVSGEALLKEQYFRANIDGSERYVLSVPKSTQYRIRSDQSGFENLFLAGDWTYNGINAGCVEAAAMSGMRAAAALAQQTVDIVGEDFTHAAPLPPNQWRPSKLLTFRAQNQSWPWSSLYGMAQTSGANAVFGLPTATVAAMLPDGLVLAPQTLTGPGEHPVIILFGWQDAVRPNIFPGGINYKEFIIAVPYVQHSDPVLRAEVPGPFITMPLLYLNKDFPIWLGIYGYGYPKKKARIMADEDSYEVRNINTGEPIISATYTAAGPTGSEMEYPKFKLTREPYSLPMISKNKLGWQYSFYDFALGQAMIQPVNMSIKIYNNQAAGLPTGLHQIPGIQANGLGGFFVATGSTINNPLQSWHLKNLITKQSENPDPDILPYP